MIHSLEPSVKLNLPDHVRILVERLTLENHELRQMNAILSRSNQDLERFAFAASHDLQEPLRAITVYAELLEKKYSRQHDEDFATFVGNIVQGATRMGALLGDLLAYAEIGATSDDSDRSTSTSSSKRLGKICKCPSKRTARQSLALNFRYYLLLTSFTFYNCFKTW